MSRLLDFSSLDNWYQAEVHGKEFKPIRLKSREYAGERTIFDGSGRQKRSFDFGTIGAIGAGWYTEAENPVPLGEELLKNKNNDASQVVIEANGLLLVKASDRDKYFPQLKKETWTTHNAKPPGLNLSKPLPPIPRFEEGEIAAAGIYPKLEGEKVAVEKCPEISPVTNSEVPAAARIDTIPFDFMFTDVAKTETATTDSSAVTGVVVEGDDYHATKTVGPATVVSLDTAVVSDATACPQALDHQEEQANRATYILDLSGIDGAALDAHASLLTGITNTTAHVVGTHVFPDGTILPTPLAVDEEIEQDRAQATDSFFNGPVEESPSPYHAPLLHDQSGFGDVREGYEEFAASWSQYDSEPTLSSPGGATYDLLNMTSVGDAEGAQHRCADVFAVQADSVDTMNEISSDIRSISRKRHARSSSGSASNSDQELNVNNVECLPSKKVRFARKDYDEVSSVGRPSMYSLMTASDDVDIDFLDGIAFLPNACFLSQISGVTSFNGQFHGLPTAEQAKRATLLNADKVAAYMGQAPHLNNLILHKDIHICPTFETTEYTPEEGAHPDSELGHSIKYNSEKTCEAAELGRSPAEETLRLEAHRECAAARLDGEVIGLYRYFKGNLTVEEYHQRNMCVCWQLCECSKLCTRFADLICPCAHKMETNCH